MSQTTLTAGHIVALTTRSDLLAEEAALVAAGSINWRGRLRQLGDYGTRGGSAMDRRLIVEAMARLEAPQCASNRPIRLRAVADHPVKVDAWFHEDDGSPCDCNQPEETERA